MASRKGRTSISPRWPFPLRRALPVLTPAHEVPAVLPIAPFRRKSLPWTNLRVGAKPSIGTADGIQFRWPPPNGEVNIILSSRCKGLRFDGIRAMKPLAKE